MNEINEELRFQLEEWQEDWSYPVGSFSSLEEGLENVRARLVLSLQTSHVDDIFPMGGDGLRWATLSDKEQKVGSVLSVIMAPHSYSPIGQYSLRPFKSAPLFTAESVNELVEKSFETIRAAIETATPSTLEMYQNETPLCLIDVVEE